MLPLKDDVPSSSVPFVTFALIGLNAAVFLYQASLGMDADPRAARAAQAFVAEFGMVPCRLTGACLVADQFPHPVVTMFTSMFLHGGLFHVGGNMLYLWIFGDNVEDTLGHGRFTLFYLASGVAAAPIIGTDDRGSTSVWARTSSCSRTPASSCCLSSASSSARCTCPR